MIYLYIYISYLKDILYQYKYVVGASIEKESFIFLRYFALSWC